MNIGSVIVWILVGGLIVAGYHEAAELMRQPDRIDLVIPANDPARNCK